MNRISSRRNRPESPGAIGFLILLVCLLSLLAEVSTALAAETLILHDGSDSYRLGKYVEFLEDRSGRLTIADVVSPNDFPGNVRELKHAMEMAVTLCTDGVITLSHLPAAICEFNAVEAPSEGSETLFLINQVRRLERELISKALDEAEGKKAVAADKLGFAGGRSGKRCAIWEW